MLEALRVLLVTNEFPPDNASGGIGSYMNHLAQLLFNKGYRVTVVSASSHVTSITQVDRTYCYNYVVPATDHATFRKAALQLFQQIHGWQSFDIIESPEVGACALEIKRHYPAIPLIVKMHTPGVLINKVSSSYTPLLQKLRFVAGALVRGKIDLGYWAKHDKNQYNDPEYQICEVADVLLSPSQALKTWAQNFWNIKKDILVLPNPYIGAVTTAVSLETKDHTICFLGKLSVLKGVFPLTTALKAILRSVKKYNVVIAGRDERISHEIPSAVEWMQSELTDFSERIEFTGGISPVDAITLLRRSSICIVPSLWENYPNVVLEAMAAGCLVIAADTGGIPEIISNGVDGVLVNISQPDDLANQVIRMCKDYELRTNIATKAKDKIAKLNQPLAEQYSSLYQQFTRKYSPENISLT